MLGSWEKTKQRSKYHFNTDLIDKKYDTVVKLGRIVPNWQHQLQEFIDTSKPATWRTRGNPKKPSRPEEELHGEEIDLENYGYGKDYVITNLNWKIPDNLQIIADTFGFEDSMARIHVQHPGQVWNLHLDKLEKWNPSNPESVMRVLIQLSDWEQGQFFSYGNYTWTHWKAGDVTTFDWMNVPHSTANAGHNPRVTLQVTGIITEQTNKFLNKLKQYQELVVA